MGQESCRNNIYANGLVQVQNTGLLEEILLFGHDQSVQKAELV